MRYKLSEQQELFVQEYIISGDVERAVIAAGYKGGDTRRIRHRGEVLLSNPYIQQEIKRRKHILEQEAAIKSYYELMRQRKEGSND